MNIKLSLTTTLADYLQETRKEKSIAAFIHTILIDYMNNNTDPTKDTNGKTNHK